MLKNSKNQAKDELTKFRETRQSEFDNMAKDVRIEKSSSKKLLIKLIYFLLIEIRWSKSSRNGDTEEKH